MGTTVTTATAAFTYYNGHRLTIWPEHQPLGPTCTCSKCGKAINDPKTIPVRVKLDEQSPEEIRLHGQCYKAVNEEIPSDPEMNT